MTMVDCIELGLWVRVSKCESSIVAPSGSGIKKNGFIKLKSKEKTHKKSVVFLTSK